MAKAAKKDKEVSLETVLWNCRVALRGIGSTEKNRDAVISLVFLKFGSSRFIVGWQISAILFLCLATSHCRNL